MLGFEGGLPSIKLLSYTRTVTGKNTSQLTGARIAVGSTVCLNAMHRLFRPLFEQ